MTTSVESALGVFERKVLRKIYGPLRVGNGEYHNRLNDEIYKDFDIVQRVKKQWLDKKTLKVFNIVPAGGIKGRGRPPLRWKDQVEKEMTELGISNWRQTAKIEMNRAML